MKIYYLDGVWLACGEGLLLYSANGKEWEDISSGVSNIGGNDEDPFRFTNILYANGVWVGSHSSGLCYSVGWELPKDEV